MILHGYFRSGTSYRTRIALNLKGLGYDQVGIDLRTGVQRSDAFLALNPQGLVPALEIDDAVLTQSPAILEWLEETYPEPSLLPEDALSRAQVRAMAALVGCDIHPLGNLRVLNAVRELGVDVNGVEDWIARWVAPGFQALEILIARHGDGWCWNDRPTLADCYLIPQIYAARRFNVDLASFERILAIEDKASEHPAFMAAHPDKQPNSDTV